MSKTNKRVTEIVIDHIEVMKNLPTKSSQIRYLDSNGYTKGEIAKILTSHYYPNNEKKVLFQHVRNVLITPLKSQSK